MRKSIHGILGRLPSRRRRFWRYVSPQRHGAGAIALALLVAVAYGYWRQTNDRKVCQQAEDYLAELTDTRVRIRSASFNFFGSIQLRDVRLALPDRPIRESFFHADRVVLRHHPWGLLLSGQLRVTEIVCLHPEVRLEYGEGLEAPALQYLLEAARRRHRQEQGPWDFRAPPIRVRDGRLTVIDVDAGGRPLDAATVPIEVSMGPEGPDEYVIVFEEPGPAGERTMQGEVRIDLPTGTVTHASSILPLERLERTLPLRYRQWARSYELTGDVQVGRRSEAGQEVRFLDADLLDVSMKLPLGHSKLDLVKVSGRLSFDEEGVTLADISGLIPQAGNARFEMSGRYDGYGPDAAYRLALEVEGMAVPSEPSPAAESGELEDALAGIREMYQPSGPMNLMVNFSRDAAGQVAYSGLVEPQGMSVVFKHFPYRLEDVRGRIEFAPDRVDLHELTGRHGRARGTLRGVVTNLHGPNVFDVEMTAENVLLDAELRAALPVEYEEIWKALTPSGRADMTVQVARQAADARQMVDVHLTSDGSASLEYTGFPYRVDGLRGDVWISDRDVRIEKVSGVRGPAACVIDGWLNGLGTDQVEVDLTVSGTGLPLDDVLADAVGEAGRAALHELTPQGEAESFEAHVWKAVDGPLDYNVTVRLADVGLNLRHFPYAIDQTAGVLTIVPGRAIIEDMRGRHGATEVQASGQIHFLDEQLGLDVRVRGEDVALDEDFRHAVGERMAGIWRQLQPTGRADMDMTLRHNVPKLGSTDYRFVLDARDMGITYEEFPYPLRGINGRAVAMPHRVHLEGMTLRHGAMTGRLDGELRFDDHSQHAELKLVAANVPIDGELLAAVPGELAPLGGRFEPGGTCDLDFQTLRVRREVPAAATQSADGVANWAETLPTAGTLQWQIAGIATLHEVAVNLGFGRKIVTGKASGSAASGPEGLAIAADVNLDSVTVGSHRVTNLVGKLAKPASSKLLRLDELEAEAHGGRLAGFAQVELSDPLRYGINLTVDRLRLEELFPPGEDEDESGRKVVGLLDGSMELIDTAGDVKDRKARGVLRVSEARMYKLPVLLDLLTIVPLSLPRDAAFTEGEFIYHLRGGDLVFDEIYLRGPTLSLVGSGRMDMPTQRLRMTFLSGPPGSLPRLSGLADEVLTGIFREIAEIEVTGTLAAPKTRTRTLGSLEDAVRRLTTPEEER